MRRRGPSRATWIALGLLVLFGAAAALAHRQLASRFPLAARDWWIPADAAPTLDPSLLARAAKERRERADELIERRQRVVPIPARLAKGRTVLQAGHRGPVAALSWVGEELVTAGDDGSLRRWRLQDGALRLLDVRVLPGRADSIVADPDRLRLWAFVAPDRLLSLSGIHLEAELVRRTPVPGIGTLVLADHGARVLLLLESPHREPRFVLRHYLADERTFLKEIALASPDGPVRRAAVDPDGRRLALLVEAAAGLRLELRRADDGGALGVPTPVAPELAGSGAGPRLLLGSDFVALATAAGLVIHEVAPDGTLGPPERAGALPFAAEPQAVSIACGAGGAAAYGETVLRFRRAGAPGGGWAAEAGRLDEGAAAALVCLPDGSWAGGTARGGLEVRRGTETARRAGWTPLEFVSSEAEAERIRVVHGALPGAAAVETEFDLRGLSATIRPVAGAVRAVDPTTGERLVVRDEVLGIESDGGFAPLAETLGEPADGAGDIRVGGLAVGGRVVELSAAGPETAAVDSAERPADFRFGVLAVAGSELRRFRGGPPERQGVPGWLRGDGSVPLRVFVAAGGEWSVLTGAGGFAVYAGAEAEPSFFFPSERYAGQAAEVSPERKRLVLTTTENEIEVWNLATQEVERSFAALPVDGGRLTRLRFAPDGSLLFCGSDRGMVSAWDGRTFNLRWAQDVTEGPVTVLEAGGPDGALVISEGRFVWLASPESGAVLAVLASDGASWAFATPDGYHLTGGAAGERLVALRLASRRLIGPEAKLELVGAGDADFDRLGGAADALRVTLAREAAPTPP